jgi:hypothetical protein
MREVFGDGRLVQHNGGLAVEALNLQEPALLLPSTSGMAVPDLSEHLGKVIHYIGVLAAFGGNIDGAAFHSADIQLPAADVPVSPMWAVISGNLGKAPELNPSKDRWGSSLAYHKDGDTTSWIKVIAYKDYSIRPLFEKLGAGTGMIAYGAFETYTYNDKPNLQLALRGLQLLKPAGSTAKAPVSLMAARSSDDIGEHAFDNAA